MCGCGFLKEGGKGSELCGAVTHPLPQDLALAVILGNPWSSKDLVPRAFVVGFPI